MAKIPYAVFAALALASVANIRVAAYETTTLSAVDVVNQELPYMECVFKYNEHQCRTDLSLLQAALIVEAGVCGLARVYVDCLEDNCFQKPDLTQRIQRVRDRCNGAWQPQATVLVVLLMLAVHLLKL